LSLYPTHIGRTAYQSRCIRLISLIDNAVYPIPATSSPQSHVLNFYKISYRTKLSGKLKYGQDYYDFDEGGLLFALLTNHWRYNYSSGNVLPAIVADPSRFFLNYPLAKKIKQYGFFSYSANEALHLSDKEKATIILMIFKIIEEELNSRIDDFSQDVIISQIELLLNYANRFTNANSLPEKLVSSDLLQKLEEISDEYFNSERSLSEGIPTVQYLSDRLNISPSYLSDMLRSLTGQNAQQHIHNKLIEKAKEKLSITNLSVSEIAYELGFEHPQSFSKFFKTKTALSPLEFRRSFN
jgi:AraC family transcriptional activator of pobA